jgi:hypothetical protein
MNALGRVLSHPICGPVYLIRSQNPNWVPRMVLFRPESFDLGELGQPPLEIRQTVIPRTGCGPLDRAVRAETRGEPPGRSGNWNGSHTLIVPGENQGGNA